ncbi:MAG: hypothetical protein HZA50_10980 [Planctomycetes bacterium]|nr:hypothetical protein [Planctomycetota bacterium]
MRNNNAWPDHSDRLLIDITGFRGRYSTTSIVFSVLGVLAPAPLSVVIVFTVPPGSGEFQYCPAEKLRNKRYGGAPKLKM